MRLLKIDVKTPETGVKTKNGVSLWIDSVVTIQVYSENSTVLDEEVKASGLKDAKLYPDYKEDETKKAPRGDAFICCYYDASYNLARKKVCNSEKEMLNLYYSLFNTCEAKYFYYTK